MDLKNKIIAITGVSEGLGRVLCREYLNNGAKVFACARNIDKFSIDFENEIGKIFHKTEILTPTKEIGPK